METLLSNLSGKVRRASLYGRPHIVAPMTMLVPGVLNGSGGPILYNSADVNETVDAWNGIPITAYHPTANGQPVSARTPDILNSNGIGVVLNASGGDKLSAEAWIDEEQANRVDERIVANLLSGEKIELSTGLFVNQLEAAPEGALFNNTTPYTAIAHNLRPDHLAFLVDQVGACSLKDGCGVLANSQTVTNELSHSDIFSRLNDAIRSTATQAEPHCWVSEVFDDHFIYWQGDDLWSRGYTKTSTGVKLSSAEPTKVVREVSYVKANAENPMKLNTEQRTAIIAGLIANSCGCWKKGDESLLNSFTDEKLGELQVANQAHQKLVENAAKAPETAPATTPAPTTNAGVAAPVTADQWLAAAPVEIQNAVKFAQAVQQRERTAIISRLVGNVAAEQQQAAATFLANKSLEDLQGLAMFLPQAPQVPQVHAPVTNLFGLGAPQQASPFQQQAVPVANYFGLAGYVPPTTNTVAPTGQQQSVGNDDLLDIPTINWGAQAPATA